MRTAAIVVCTDGTEAGGPAVRWATREAGLRRRPLRIVYADMSRVGGTVPQLLRACRDAELLVLGNRGRGGFASLLYGSVGRRVAAHAACPVVIVRGRGDVTDGPVVVEVDDTPYAEELLSAAFELADERGCGIVAVRTYLSPLPCWLGDSDPASVAGTVERTRLERLVAPWCDKYPQVATTTLVSPDPPSAVLVAASLTAQLVLVGAPGHGEGRRTLRDSAGLHLLDHADCPVLVHRAPTRRPSVLALSGA